MIGRNAHCLARLVCVYLQEANQLCIDKLQVPLAESQREGGGRGGERRANPTPDCPNRNVRHQYLLHTGRIVCL